MKHHHLFVLLFSFSPFLSLQAQEFIGYVKKFDTTAVAAYQAKVEVKGDDQLSTFIKTYFDGSYKFTPEKKKTYTVRISYPGYTDTTFTLTCDKKGVVTPPTFTAVLKKDGMRLVGILKSKEDNFPIKDATIAVKNVMTQQEQRITTGIDGYFNFKLEYETMYRVYIDKYSPGIANKYKDTSLYISTVRFNKPIDYKIEIALSTGTEKITIPEGYKSNRAPLNKNVKPVVEVTAFIDTTTTPKETPAERKQEETAPVTQKQIEPATTDTVVAKEERKIEPAATSTQAEPAFVPDESLIVVMSNDLKRETEDSINKVKAAQQKAYNDSVSKAAEAKQKAEAETTSFDALKAETERLEQEIQAQKRRADSLTKAAILLRKKFTEDSVKQEKIKQEEMARKKAYDDSVRTALELKRKKEVADSLLAVKLEKERIAREALERKKREDSIATALALVRKKFVEDSIKLEKLRQQELARKKAYDDSIKTALESKRRREIADSLLVVKTEKERIAREALERKKREDSIATALALVRKKFVEDSVKLVKLRLQEAARQKLYDDSVKAALVAKRKKEVADSLAAANAAQQQLALEAALQKEREDSITKAKALAAKIFTEDSIKQAAALANKRATEDSLRLALERKRRQLTADSLKAINSENERKAKEYLNNRKIEDSVAFVALQEQKKRLEDSLTRVILAQQEAFAKREAEDRRKAGEDSLAEAQKEDSKLVKETAGLDFSEQIIQPQNPNSYYAIKSTARPKARYKILFGKNSYRLNSYAKEGLAKAIQFMKVNKTSEIKIYGNVAEGEKKTEELMQLRTDAIIKVLLENGISVDRISVYSPEVEKLSYDWGTVGELLKQFRWTILEVSDN